jgi:hypothetical protein
MILSVPSVVVLFIMAAIFVLEPVLRMGLSLIERLLR